MHMKNDHWYMHEFTFVHKMLIMIIYGHSHNHVIMKHFMTPLFILKLKVRLDNGGAAEPPLVPGGFKNEVLANQAMRLGSSTRCRSWGRGPWRRVKRLSGRETWWSGCPGRPRTKRRRRRRRRRPIPGSSCCSTLAEFPGLELVCLFRISTTYFSSRLSQGSPAGVHGLTKTLGFIWSFDPL